ncbi:MAG: DUF6691 family protein [Alcanivorax sp.]|uniref:DUF6691 family protein n=1 Tax=Alcanivorax sp. TaxID=1872427 RepID=UPI003DA7356A
MELILAIVLGTAFGFVLQRIGAADPDKIIGMLRLTDLHLMKTILCAVGVSSGLLFTGMATGLIDSSHLSIKASYTGVLVGGLLLGAGWATAGFCPGTGLVAAGSGRRDALAFLAGGLVGAALFMVSYASLKDTMLFASLLGGKSTLADTGVYPALVTGSGAQIAVLIAIVLVGLSAALPMRLRRLHKGK